MAASMEIVWIGFSVLVLNILSKYLNIVSFLIVKVFYPTSKEEKTLRGKLNESRESLSKINMVDEFAKYARTKRTLSKLKEDLKAIGSKRSSIRMKINMTIQSLYYVLYLAMLVSLMVTYRDIPLMKLPTQWLWPLTFPVSFPSGVPGGIGIAFWLFVTNQVSRTLTTSFYA